MCHSTFDDNMSVRDRQSSLLCLLCLWDNHVLAAWVGLRVAPARMLFLYWLYYWLTQCWLPPIIRHCLPNQMQDHELLYLNLPYRFYGLRNCGHFMTGSQVSAMTCPGLMGGSGSLVTSPLEECTWDSIPCAPSMDYQRSDVPEIRTPFGYWDAIGFSLESRTSTWYWHILCSLWVGRGGYHPPFLPVTSVIDVWQCMQYTDIKCLIPDAF